MRYIPVPVDTCLDRCARLGMESRAVLLLMR